MLVMAASLPRPRSVAPCTSVDLEEDAQGNPSCARIAIWERVVHRQPHYLRRPRTRTGTWQTPAQHLHHQHTRKLHRTIRLIDLDSGCPGRQAGCGAPAITEAATTGSDDAINRDEIVRSEPVSARKFVTGQF